jgi:hypothetical protein
VRAAVPVGVPAGSFGPRVQAMMALCAGADHVSKRTTQNVMAALFGVTMGWGTVANLEQATAQALAEPVAAARASVQTQPGAYLDATGWRAGRQRPWLWAAVTAWGTVFVIRRSRRRKVAQELLGERWGGIWSRIAGAPPPGIPHGGGSGVGRIGCATSQP